MRLLAHTLLPALALTASATASAQVIIVERGHPCYGQYERLQGAITTLATMNTIRFRIEASERNGLRTQRFPVNAHWLRALERGGERYYFELNEYSSSSIGSGPLLRRMVGDGENFYVYNSLFNTYTVSRYGGDKRRLVREIMRNAGSGPSSMIATVLDQAHGGPYPLFYQWLPGIHPERSKKDDSNIVFSVGSVPGCQIGVAFLLFPLHKIVRTEEETGFGVSYKKNWEMSIDHPPLGSAVGGATFRFVPPKGATARN